MVAAATSQGDDPDRHGDQPRDDDLALGVIGSLPARAILGGWTTLFM